MAQSSSKMTLLFGSVPNRASSHVAMLAASMLLTVSAVGCQQSTSPSVAPPAAKAEAPAPQTPTTARAPTPAPADTPAPGAAPPAERGTTKGAAPTEEPVVVEIWHDVVCPWCRIGHAHVKVATGRFKHPVKVVLRPYLLNPDAPMEPQNLKKRLGDKYGAERVDGMFARLIEIGDKAGLKFSFTEQTRSFNSLAAHALLDWAPEPKGGDILDGLHEAYFVRNDDISSPIVLGAIAAAAGLNAKAAMAAVADPERLAKVRAAATKRSAIRGVPYFKIGDHVLRGAQPPEKILLALRAAATAK